MTRACGVAVGILRHENIVYVARAGIVAPIASRHFKAEIFQLRLNAGELLQLPDAQQHSLLGSDCRREGIRSLVVAPVMHKGKVTGIIELTFAESRSFSLGDVMDIELIAAVVSEVANHVAQNESEQAEELEYRTEVDDILDAEFRAAKQPTEQGSKGNVPQKDSDFADSPESMVFDALNKLAGAPIRLAKFCKEAWAKRPARGCFVDSQGVSKAPGKDQLGHGVCSTYGRCKTGNSLESSTEASSTLPKIPVVATRKCRINCNETVSPPYRLSNGGKSGSAAEVVDAWHRGFSFLRRGHGSRAAFGVFLEGQG